MLTFRFVLLLFLKRLLISREAVARMCAHGVVKITLCRNCFVVLSVNALKAVGQMICRS